MTRSVIGERRHRTLPVKENAVAGQQLIEPIELANIACEHYLAVLDGLKVEHRIIEQRLPSLRSHARKPHCETSQNACFPQCLDRGRLQSMRSDIQDHSRNFTAYPLRSMISRIQAAEKVGQFGKRDA